MLVAISTCATLGYAISAFDIIPLLFYPFLLCLSSLLFIPCLTRNKASHFVCLQREPTFSRRWALGVMLPRYLYDAVLWPLSAEITM